MRIFISVDLPATIKAEVSAFQEAFKETRASIKWARPESLHLTLKFLGEIDKARLSEIKDVVSTLTGRHRRMTLSLNGIGVFPNLSNPRIFWVGLGGETEKFASLAEEIDLGISALGFPREDRSYNPHLTIGRFKSPHGASELISQARQYPLPELTFSISEVNIMRSILNPQAAVYTSLFSGPLRGGLN
jgi:2'-5' RNA ligase